MVHRTIVATLLIAAIPSLGRSQALYEPLSDPESPSEIPFHRYFTKDNLGRRITFYLGNEPAARSPLPLVVFILGSGAHSNFIERDGRIFDANRSLREAVAGRARVLVVEKPGVSFLSQPDRNGTALGASEEFLREHTLDRWSEAVSAAINAASKLPRAAPGRMLVAGHSEGSLTAFRVAAKNPKVTHVAGLAGFTTSYLRCFMSDPSWGDQELGALDDPQQRIDTATAAWRQILAERDEYRKMFAGHSYRYWASMKSHTPVEFAMSSSAKIYLAQGTEDGKCSVDDFELLYAQLIDQSRQVVAELIKGADHGFSFPGSRSRDGWKEQIERTVNWFFDDAQ